MTTAGNTGGLVLIRSNGDKYVDAHEWDVGIYSSDRSKNVMMGPSNVHQLPMLMMTNSNVLVESSMVTSNMFVSSNMIKLTIGGPVGESLYSTANFPNNATFAVTSKFAGSNTFMGPSNMFKNDTYFKGTNSVLVGTPVPTVASYPLEVLNYVNSTLNGRQGSHNISIFANGDMSSLSDITHKTDCLVIPNALEKVQAISGYTFSWLEDSGSRAAGVIAQEVQAVLPEVIVQDSQGKLGVSYGNMSALLIQAIKELAGQKLLLTVTTVASDEEFSIPLPNAIQGRRWAAAFLSSVGQQYSKRYASVSEDGRSVVGRAEAPGTYSVLVVGA